MNEIEERRQADSARCYVALVVSSSALRATVTLAAESMGFPEAMVNILDEAQRHNLLAVGMAKQPPLARRETVCDAVVGAGAPIAIADVRADSRGQALAARGSDLRAYMGVPLTGREGVVIGTLCLLDTEPHPIDEEALHRLGRFASVVEEQLELLRRLGPSLGVADVAELSVGIDEGQIVPWFQPLVDLRTRQTVAWETLARWEHPSRGLLAAPEFIPLAEDSELIIDLDLALMRQAAGWVKKWRRRDPGVFITVNLSGRHFRRPDCVERLHDAVIAANVPTDAVVLELTETLDFASSDHNIAQLAGLRELGFRVLLDDFGTGWSTLDHLVYLPCDGLKIASSTTRALRTRAGDAVVHAVAELAVELGKVVVIEGVESLEQATRALELGCTHGQGYLWSGPMPAGAVARAHRTP